MGIATIFKYISLAMQAADKAAEVSAKIKSVKSPTSPGGKEITAEEMKMLIEDLDNDFSEVITGICINSGLPVESVEIEIKMK